MLCVSGAIVSQVCVLHLGGVQIFPPVRKAMLAAFCDPFSLLSMSFSVQQKKRFKYSTPHNFCEVLPFACYYLTKFDVLV